MSKWSRQTLNLPWVIGWTTVFYRQFLVRILYRVQAPETSLAEKRAATRRAKGISYFQGAPDSPS